MLDSVWHLRGSVALNRSMTDEVVLDRVARLLDKQWKPVIERGSDYLVFEDPIWCGLFRPNWLAMVIYDLGVFHIERGKDGRRLRYDLRSLHGLIFCLFAAFAFFSVASAGEGMLRGLTIGAFAFAWLYGMNVLLALARVPASIRTAVGAD